MSQNQLQLSRNHFVKHLMVRQEEEPVAGGFVLGFTKTHHSLGTSLCLPPVPALPVLSFHEDTSVVAFSSGSGTQRLL